MPKYLLELTYTAQGAKGVMKTAAKASRSRTEGDQEPGRKMKRSTLRSARRRDLITDLPDAVAAAALDERGGYRRGGTRVRCCSRPRYRQGRQETASYTPPGS